MAALEATLEEKSAREKQLLAELKKKGDAARQIITSKDEELSLLKEKLRAAVEVATTLSNAATAAGSHAGQVPTQEHSGEAGTPASNARLPHNMAVHFAAGEHGHEPADSTLSDINTNSELRPKALFRHPSDRAMFTQEEVILIFHYD